MRFTLNEILFKNTNERVVNLKYLIGLKCDILRLEENTPMIINFETGYICSTTCVKSIDETDCGIWVITEKTAFRFDDNF